MLVNEINGISNSDKLIPSCDDLYLDVTFFGTQCIVAPVYYAPAPRVGTLSDEARLTSV